MCRHTHAPSSAHTSASSPGAVQQELAIAKRHSSTERLIPGRRHVRLSRHQAEHTCTQDTEHKGKGSRFCGNLFPCLFALLLASGQGNDTLWALQKGYLPHFLLHLV